MIPTEILERCYSKTQDCISKITQKYPYKIRPITLSFNLRGQSAGTANIIKHHIKINPILLMENLDEMINQTSPHEVAHIAADIVYRRSCKAHGWEWKHLMSVLGCKPLRTHNYDVSKATVRHVRRYNANCGCKEHPISSIIYKRIVKGRTYTCTTCKQKLTI
jgi:SprT protein